MCLHFAWHALPYSHTSHNVSNIGIKQQTGITVCDDSKKYYVQGRIYNFSTYKISDHSTFDCGYCNTGGCYNLMFCVSFFKFL